jgi:flagella basal body P-ring formation protein FlgA
LLAYLKRATIVRPGMTVNVFFQSGGITITSVAQALGEGGIGDMVMARNLQSGRSIRGLVQHDGSLRVMP